jgi:hypothetical protein
LKWGAWEEAFSGPSPPFLREREALGPEEAIGCLYFLPGIKWERSCLTAKLSHPGSRTSY